MRIKRKALFCTEGWGKGKDVVETRSGILFDREGHPNLRKRHGRLMAQHPTDREAAGFRVSADAGILISATEASDPPGANWSLATHAR